jgi:hypothetical protein
MDDALHRLGPLIFLATSAATWAGNCGTKRPARRRSANATQAGGDLLGVRRRHPLLGTSARKRPIQPAAAL